LRKGGNDAQTPAPLTALGGWRNADWFCPSVVLDRDVVGFSLPELGGRRKQSFRVVERLLADKSAGKTRKTSKTAEPAPTGIGPALDRAGATSIAAFRRTTFLFESSAILYFANIPAARLKVRSSNRLRRDLLESRFRGCVLRIEDDQVTAMFWPSAEVGITGFVEAALPPHALHAEFDEAEAKFGNGRDAVRSPPGSRRASMATQERQNLHRERQVLLAEVAALRAQIDKLQESQSTLGAMEKLGLDDARLKSMLTLLHPDKHGNSESANDAAKWVNNLRDILKRKVA
jgi:hypothetical protein